MTTSTSLLRSFISIFAALVVVAFGNMGAAAPVQAEHLYSIGGATVSGNTTYVPDTTNAIYIHVNNPSWNSEAIYDVTLTFPAGWTIADMQGDANATCGGYLPVPVYFAASGTGTNTGAFTHIYDGSGGINYNCSWDAVFHVNVPADASGDKTVNWHLVGRFYDSLTGSFTLTEAPNIHINPSSLVVTLYPGDITTSTLTIDYVGNAGLIWSLAENPAVTWLSESPTSGTVASGNSTPVSVTFDSSGLANDTYTTTLQITSNDPDEPQVDVPVTLTVALIAFSDINAGLPELWSGSGIWGDYDNDGNLDILLTGYAPSSYITRVYHNNGNGTFTDINAELPGVSSGSVAWGDYDNDGNLDILLTGYAPSLSYITRVYHNNGNGTFTDINAGLPGGGGSVAWGDYNNDGDLDILLTGYNGSGYIAKIYRNDGNGVFTDIGAALPNGEASFAVWGDYNNDGRLDILLTEGGGFYATTYVYRNDGNGVFTNIGVALPSYSVGNGRSAVWGDYNNDGKLDILLVEYLGGGSEVAKIYRNDGGGVFTDINATLTGLSGFSAAAWGDYDNDGKLDILSTAGIYRNDGNGVFTNIGVGGSAWGDYNNDGKLDIVTTAGKIYRNNAATANTVPSAPTGLTAAFVGQDVTFSWNMSSDAQTPANGLTYNLRVGTTPGGTQVVAPMAADTGYRRIPQRGNAEYNLSATIKNLPYGTYYWSVQAVDSAWAGSPFASEESVAPTPIAGLSIGPKWAYPSVGNLFIAAVNPLTTTQPITYTWQASGQIAVTYKGGGLTDAVTFTWPSGTVVPQVITVTASNPLGVFTGTQIITLKPPSTDAHTLLVDTTIDSNNPAYQACATAASDCSLRGAISKANADTGHPYTVELPSGVYSLTLSGDEDNNATGDLDIKSNVTLVGAGADFTIINGNRLDRVLDIHSGVGVTINDIGITGGLSSGQGAGIYIASSSVVTLSNVTVIGNTASGTGEGGGIYNAGVLTVTTSAVINNVATGATGNSGTTGTTGAYGTYPAGTGGTGGDGGTGGNGSDGRGGGIYNAGTLDLVNTTLDGNRAQGGVGGAGGRGGTGGTGGTGSTGTSGGIAATCPSGYTCTIYEGWGGNGGTGGTGGTGGSGGNGGIGGNGLGGGLYNVGVVSTLNATLSDNQTMTGAAGCGGSGDTRGWGGAGGSGGLCYSSCTGGGTCVCGPGRTGADGSSGSRGANGSNGSAGLSGSTHGGGVYVVGSGVTFNNTLAAANDAQTGPDGYGQLTLAGRNFIQTTVGYTLTGEVGAVISGTAPQLGPLQDNGGPTYTRAPLPGSPVIDAGDNASCPATDQRGYVRPVDGDGNGSAICDIGAVEYGARATLVPGIPTLLAPPSGTITTSRAIAFSWQSGAGATQQGYNVQVDSGNVITVTGTTSTTILSEGVHTWTVRAYNAVGYSAWVTPWSVEVRLLHVYLPLVLR